MSTLAATLDSLTLPLPTLTAISDRLLPTFHDALAHSHDCMLPSYVYRQPTGLETGHALALDLGGSTLRVAILHLAASTATILHRREWVVDDTTKQLPTTAFFDWIASNISSLLLSVPVAQQPKVIGVAWSFPIEQTSLASGNLNVMGKGFTTSQNPPTRDLRTLFHDAFARAGLHLTMTSLMNDTEATLLTHAYTHPLQQHTFSIILGTGINAAISLPLPFLPAAKLTNRPEVWRKVAKHVLINTELSMFGGHGVLPLTRADVELDAAQKMPGFQPLEQVSSGRYLGEVLRRTVVALAEGGEVFKGGLPGGWEVPWALGTPVAVLLEAGEEKEGVRAVLERAGFVGVEVEEEDVRVLREVARAVMERAAVMTAVSVWTLWRMQREGLEGTGEVGVAFAGSVLEKHLEVRRRCQEVLDQLAEGGRWRLVLEEAGEAGLVGAAVGALVGVVCEQEMGSL